MTISDKTRKILWSRSGGCCAICKVEFVTNPTSANKLSIIGEECHIISKRTNGPRFNEESTSDILDHYDNLILLCANHHKLIDDQVDYYSVERLQQIKRDHEDWVRAIICKLKSVENVNEPSYNGITLLPRIKSGVQLVKHLGGIHFLEHNHDELIDEEYEIVANFMQELSDYSEVYCDLEIKDRILSEQRLDEGIKELESIGLLVFGNSYIKNAVMLNTKSNWKILSIHILRENNPSIIHG
jgi:hypothetical protein